MKNHDSNSTVHELSFYVNDQFEGNECTREPVEIIRWIGTTVDSVFLFPWDFVGPVFSWWKVKKVKAKEVNSRQSYFRGRWISKKAWRENGAGGGWWTKWRWRENIEKDRY